MGLFNYTCGLSGLPIPPGEPVRAFLITRSCFEPDSGMALTNRWLVRTGPMRSKYSGYGGLDRSASSNRLEWFAWRRMFRNDIPDDIGIEWGNGSDFAQVQAHLHAGTLSVYKKVSQGKQLRPVDASRKRLPVAWVMVREDVWQGMLMIDGCLTLTIRDRAKDIIADLFAGKKWNEGKKLRSQKSGIPILDETREFLRRFDFGPTFIHDVPYHAGLEAYFREAVNAVSAKTTFLPEEIDSFALGLSEIIHINTLMAQAERSWNPPFGGGQEMSWDLQQKITAIFHDVAKSQEETASHEEDDQ